MSYWPLGDSVEAMETEDGFPKRFTWRKRVHTVSEVANVWRIDDSWWQKRIWQDYFKLVTTTGLLVILSHDLTTDEWFMVRVYD